MAHTDSLARKGICNRDGVGKLRHDEVQYMWLQQAVRSSRFTMRKVAGYLNPASLLTKYLSAADIEQRLSLIGMRFESGRTTTVDGLEKHLCPCLVCFPASCCGSAAFLTAVGRGGGGRCAIRHARTWRASRTTFCLRHVVLYFVMDQMCCALVGMEPKPLWNWLKRDTLAKHIVPTYIYIYGFSCPCER